MTYKLSQEQFDHARSAVFKAVARLFRDAKVDDDSIHQFSSLVALEWRPKSWDRDKDLTPTKERKFRRDVADSLLGAANILKSWSNEDGSSIEAAGLYFGHYNSQKYGARHDHRDIIQFLDAWASIAQTYADELEKLRRGPKVQLERQIAYSVVAEMTLVGAAVDASPTGLAAKIVEKAGAAIGVDISNPEAHVAYILENYRDNFSDYKMKISIVSVQAFGSTDDDGPATCLPKIGTNDGEKKP